MAGHVPKYLRVKTAILQDIRRGKRKLGDQLPTREALIRHFKVTRTTVDKALGELIREGVLKSSRRLGTFVAMPQPPLAVAVVSPLAVDVVPSPKSEPNDLQRMFGTMMLQARAMQFKFLDDKALRGAINQLKAYEAVVWVQPDDQTLAGLSELGTTVLVTNRYPENMNFVSTNHRAAMREVTEHYIKHCGPQSQIFYLDPLLPGFVYRERKEGFIEACEKSRCFYRVCPVQGDFTAMHKTVTGLSLNTRQPVLMISPIHSCAGAVLAAAREKALRFGKNFYYADFDNATSKERYGVQVTTIIQDYAAMGAAVVEGLADLVKKPVRKFIPYKIEGRIKK
jgi:hypothetical protein